MPTQKVIAYFMHEPERDFAQKALSNGTTTERFVVGDIDTDQIPNLRAQRVIVTSAADPAPAAKPVPVRSLPSSFTAGVGFGAAPSLPNVLAAAFPRPVDFYRVTLQGPLLESWRQELKKMGIHLISRMRDASDRNLTHKLSGSAYVGPTAPPEKHNPSVHQ